MRLVERHYINKDHKDFLEIDAIAFKSKNLYNYALYVQRQHFFKTQEYINYNDLDKQLQEHEAYKALPAKVSQQTLLKLHKNWLSFFALIKNKDPKARIPKYLDKEKGRFLVTYTKQGIKKHNILSKTNIKITTEKDIQEVRLVHKVFGYIIEVVHEKKEKQKKAFNNKVASGDLGTNNLIAITSNCAKALIINGRILKSINQYYNKVIARKSNNKFTIQKRYFRIKNYFHHASKLIIDYLLKHKITRFIVGHNDGQKQEINLGKKTNQNFCFIPFLDFIKQLEYKCRLVGIDFVVTEEAYTSKASYYDGDIAPSYVAGIEYEFSGKRVKRGLYKCGDGSKINADLNGSLNIGRKVIHDYVVDRSLVARPLRVNPLIN